MSSFAGMAQNGMAQNGMIQNGMIQNGMAQNGMILNGMAQNGMTQNGMAQGTPVGTHLLLNVYDVDSTLLTYLTRGQPLLEQIVRELRLSVVAETGHQFTPIGYTYAYVLSESHFTIHTYPEHKSCYIDIFCCSSSFNALHAIQRIKSVFHTENVSYQIVKR